VGQNESGKSSVLDALAVTFSNTNITDDDLRSGAPLPIVFIKVECPFVELEESLSGVPGSLVEAVRSYWEEKKGVITTKFTWKLKDKSPKREYVGRCAIEDAIGLAEMLGRLAKTVPADLPTDANKEKAGPNKPLSLSDVENALFAIAPMFVAFNESSGTLPNEVDLDNNNEPTGPAAQAAKNYLTAAQINLPELIQSDRRTRESVLLRANARLTQDFKSFWTQTIGKETKLKLSCEIEFHHNSTGAEKAGRPHLVFWISDGHTHLYPSQRSKGVRWFVSFFLQLHAAEDEYGSSVFLLDEPGANLHAKAQGDVLKVINALRERIPIVYSTHSPHLIEYEHLHRIHAVQRAGEEEDSPTTVLDAHRLGAASTDTLSPILNAMGSDLSSQQTIQKSDNVLVEEVSGFYYLTAFWKLTAQKQSAYFIASTGVNKLSTLANLFLGWGLEFITVVDDDNQGRGVYKDLLQDLYGGDTDLASGRVLKLKGCDGIEDVFSASDFKQFVLRNMDAEIAQKNTEFLKRAGRSKPIMALEFKLAVDRGEILFDQLDEATRAAIKEIVEGISERLARPVAKAD
jgi:hypothetical protein